MNTTFSRTMTAIVFALCAAFALSACSQNDSAPQASTPADSPQAATTGELPIAVQMWTVRSLPTLEDQLQAVQAAGVRAVEVINTHGLPAGELKALLDQYSLQVTSMHLHTPMSELTDNLDELIQASRTLGTDRIVMPWIPPENRPTDAAGWIAIGELLGEAARKVEAAGLTLAWHNHDFEMAEFDGKTALELLFEAAGPALKTELDVAWITIGGRDPVEFLNKYSGRVFAIHAKDKASEDHQMRLADFGADVQDWDPILAEMGLADVGAGVLDWDRILAAAHAAGVEWYIIEHDAPSDPAVSIKNSAAFLTERLPAVGVTAR